MCGNGPNDDQLLKFDSSGKFQLQIGHSSKSQGSNDIENLGGPAAFDVDPAANEVWVADGYRNRRVIVFDATTGAYRRHFGAYGNVPDDDYRFPDDIYGRTLTAEDGLPPQFASPVHFVRISREGLVYVCDRTNGRVQIFRKDGTYVREFLYWPRVTSELNFSHDPGQQFAYLADFRFEKVWILERSTMQIVSSFGHPGHFGGGFTVLHSVAVDQKGNIYTTEVLEGKRVQRFLYRGARAAVQSESDLP